MIVNDNFVPPVPPAYLPPKASDIIDYVRGISIDLEKMSQEAGLEGMAACLRAVVNEARRAKNDDRLLKLGLTPDRRLG